jgi:putative tryptophan/tyrosine transport system substrate-binding protein
MRLASLAALIIAVLLSLSPTAWSQPTEKTRRIGVILNFSRSDPGNARGRDVLLDGLREHGWEEGKNIVLEERFAGGDAARFPELVAELVGLGVDVILVTQTQAVIAARAKTTTIPIIMVSIADPVGSGLVASLARPGGNITGMANLNEAVSAKNLELLKENKPGIKRIGIFYSHDNSPSARTVKAMQEEVAPRSGLTVLPLDVTKVGDFAEAFATVIREQVEALHVLPTPPMAAHRVKIAEFAIQHRLPTTAPADYLVRDGILMSYGADILGNWHRVGSFVDRIFKGAKPADLPVEQVDRFKFVINLKTARAIGFDATSLVPRADEVIE